MSKIITSILFASVLLISCSKSKDTNEIAVEGKLLGKWNFDSEVYFNGIEWKTITVSPGQYLEFTSGGKLTAKIDGRISYSTWELLDGGKTLFIADNGVLDVAENGYQIKQLTSSKLELYGNDEGAPANQAITLNLSK